MKLRFWPPLMKISECVAIFRKVMFDGTAVPALVCITPSLVSVAAYQYARFSASFQPVVKVKRAETARA